MEFENRYYCTDDMMSEYVHKVVCRRLYALGFIFAPLGLIMVIISALQGNAVMVAVFSVCLFIVLVTVAIAPHMTLHQLKQGNLKIHNGAKVETVVTFDETVIQAEGTNRFIVEYEQIDKVYYLRHTCVLWLGKYGGILLSPYHFTKGTYDEFKVFIKAECVNAK